MENQTQEATFADRAEHEINDVLSFEPAAPDPDRAHWYAALFLIDYRVALNSANTSGEYFLGAYSNRALAIRYCPVGEREERRESLDLEAFRLRQEWRMGRGA